MHEKSRAARSMLATVPMIIVGSLALSLVVAPSAQATPLEKSPTRKWVKQKALGVSKASKSVSTKAATKTAAAPTTYTVLAGDTVSSIAVRYGLSTASVLALNGLGWKSMIHPGQVLKLSKSTTAPKAVVAAVKKYTIATGDTISAIAKKFGVTPNAVLSANGLTASSLIYPGVALTIPGASTAASTSTGATIATTTASSVKSTTSASTKYTIATGDTISTIAKKFEVSVDSILSSNSLNASSLIYPGKVITVPTPSAYVAGKGVVTLLTKEMTTNATIIVATGRSLGVSDRGIVIALATAMQESGLRNINYGHLDSVGLFQQRPSIGWGTKAQLLDPKYAALLFYGGPSSPNRKVVRGLLDVPGWKSMTVTQAAQAVQVSAYPQAYAQWETSAEFWLSQLS